MKTIKSTNPNYLNIPSDKSWEKHWDKQFKKELSAVCINTGKYVYTFNDIAKQFIHSEIMKAQNKAINKLIKDHNLIVLAKEFNSSSSYKNGYSLHLFKRLIKEVEEQSKRGAKIAKELKRILKGKK